MEPGYKRQKQADHLGGSKQSQLIKLKTMEFQRGPLSDPYQEYKERTNDYV